MKIRLTKWLCNDGKICAKWLTIKKRDFKAGPPALINMVGNKCSVTRLHPKKQTNKSLLFYPHLRGYNALLSLG